MKKMTRDKDKVRATIYTHRDRLVQLAHDIHAHPEVAYTEAHAAARITTVLADAGFTVRTGVYGLPTAFIASVGHGPLHIAFCAEYDALPPSCLFDRSKKPGLVEVWLHPERQDGPMRHACGHNLIAGAAVAAATGLRDIADEVGLTVSVFGTPGEELAGLPELPVGRQAPGKIALLEAGAFDSVHAALMVHPGPTPVGAFAPSKAYLRQRAQFSRADAGGRVLDRAALQQLEVTLQRTITALHQIPNFYFARPEAQTTGAQVDIVWIAPSLAEANHARAAVRQCFEAVASACGSTVDITEYAPYAEMRHDPRLAAAYRTNAHALGRMDPGLSDGWQLRWRAFWWIGAKRAVYGTDMGNVSQVIPAIHPFLGIGRMAFPHSVAFAAQADTDEAYQAMVDGGVALAWTALDAATDPALRAYLLEAAASRAGRVRETQESEGRGRDDQRTSEGSRP